MENNNSVCFVGKIEEIKPIENADNIVQAIISGWECVIQKDTYKVGSLVILATQDAIIPLELADKLNATTYLKHRKKADVYTVKTTKLRGVYSSALIVDDTVTKAEGTDMMDILGINKYEEPEIIVQSSDGHSHKYRKNPNFHVYYKFPNIKNATSMFTADDMVVATRKIHGTNARYGIVKKNKLSLIDKIKRFFGNKWVDYDYVYGSHQVEKGSESQHFYTENVWAAIDKKLNIKELLWGMAKALGKTVIGNNFIIYGEIYGPGIQKYYDYNKKELDIYFFDIKLNDEYLEDKIVEKLLSTMLCNKVPTLYKGLFNQDAINKHLQGCYIEGTKIPHEGVVVKAVTGSRDKIAKFVNPEYLEFQSKKSDSTDFH